MRRLRRPSQPLRPLSIIRRGRLSGMYQCKLTSSHWIHSKLLNSEQFDQFSKIKGQTIPISPRFSSIPGSLRWLRILSSHLWVSHPNIIFHVLFSYVRMPKYNVYLHIHIYISIFLLDLSAFFCGKRPSLYFNVHKYLSMYVSIQEGQKVGRYLQMYTQHGEWYG